MPSSSSTSEYQSKDTFGDDTTFDIDQFEDYYDDLFEDNEIAINAIDDDQEELITNELVTISSVQTERLRLLKKKLILAKALKGLRKLIMLSNLQDEEEDNNSLVSGRGEVYEDDYGGDYQDTGMTTILPWWARSNSHGRKRKKKKRRKKRFSFWYDLLL